MSPPVAWGRWSILSVGLIGLGYGIMKLTTPTDQQFYDSLAPDLKRQVDARRAARRLSEKQASMLTSNPDDAKPVWADKPSS